MLSDEEKEALQYFNTETKTEAMHYGAVLVKLIEKQSKEIEEYEKQLDLDNECEIALNSKVMDLEKEIEELKEDKYGLEEEVQIQAKQLIEIDGNYISKEESEQRERKAYIKGTNDADELCNKKWGDKIKAKIEFIKSLKEKLYYEENIISILQSLLEKE